MDDDKGDSRGGAQLPFRGKGSGSQAWLDEPGSSKQASATKKTDESKNQLRPLSNALPDLMTGLSKKEKAALFRQRVEASQGRAAGEVSSKAEGKKSESKAEGKKPETKAEGKKPQSKAEGKKPEPKVEDKKPMSKAEGKKPENKAEGKKPQAKAEAEVSGIQAEVKQAEEKNMIRIHDNLKDRMFFV